MHLYIKAFRMLLAKSLMHAWQKQLHKDPSDEERTTNQGYFTWLATHVLIINNNQCNGNLTNLKQFTKIVNSNWL